MNFLEDFMRKRTFDEQVEWEKMHEEKMKMKKKIKDIINYYKSKKFYKDLDKNSMIKNLDFRTRMLLEDRIKKCGKEPKKEELLDLGFYLWINCIRED